MSKPSRERSLAQLALRLPERLTPEALGEQVLLALASWLGVTEGSLVLLDGLDGEVFVASRLIGGTVTAMGGAAVRAQLASPLMVRNLQSGQGLAIADLARDRRRHLVPEHESGSFVAWPVQQGQQQLGVLTAYSPLPYAFANQEVPRIEALLALAASAVGESLRARAESLHRAQSLALLNLSQLLSNDSSTTELAAVLHHCGQVFGASSSLLFLADECNNLLPVELTTALRQPGNELVLRRLTMLATQVWSTQTALTARPVPGEIEQHSVAFPLVHGGSCCGALVLVSAGGPLAYSQGSWSLLTVLTQMLAAACDSLIQRSGARLRSEALAKVKEQRGLIQRSRDLIRTLFDSMPEGMLLLDADEGVLAANTAFCELLRKHPREVVGQSYGDLWETILDHSEVYTADGVLHICTTHDDGKRAWYAVERSDVLERGHADDACFIEIWREMEACEPTTMLP